jgi:uncharacterized membrane protein
MTLGTVLLIAGLLLFAGTHLFGRFFPERRAALSARLGAGPARGVIALALVLSIVLMVMGYQSRIYTSSRHPHGRSTSTTFSCSLPLP